MKYILDFFEGEEYWIELDNEGYALRQMIIGNNATQISCLTDCLAEGVVLLEELDGDIKIIEQEVFESRWRNSLKDMKVKWELKKKEYTIGKQVIGKLKYYYPQGAIIQLNEIQGVCSDDIPSGLIISTELQCTVTGYDEINLWITLSPVDNL